MNNDRGELARFLMCSPPDWRGFIILGPPVPAAHVSLAEECMQRLGKLSASPPRIVGLTQQSRDRFEAWGTVHQRLQRPGGARREPKEWVAKMPGLVLRLAGVIHAAESIMEADSVARDLPLAVLERAIAIAEWGFSQACAVYRVSQENTVSRRLVVARGRR